MLQDIEAVLFDLDGSLDLGRNRQSLSWQIWDFTAGRITGSHRGHEFFGNGTIFQDKI